MTTQTPDPGGPTRTLVEDAREADAGPRDGAAVPGRRRGGAVAILVSVVGVAVIAVMLVQGVLAAVAGGGTSEQTHYTADVGDVTGVTIGISGANVTVSYGDVPEATLDVESSGWRADERWRFEVDGDRLVVSDQDRNWFIPDFGTRWVAAEVVLPRELEGEVDVVLDLSAGDLDVVGDYRDVRIEVSAGAVQFDGASTALSVDVNAGSSTVTTEGPSSVAVEVSAGRATTAVTGEPPATTTVDVSAGDAVLSVPDAAYSVGGEASAGDRTIDVRTDPSSPYAMTVDVSAGSAEVGYSD